MKRSPMAAISMAARWGALALACASPPLAHAQLAPVAPGSSATVPPVAPATQVRLMAGAMPLATRATPTAGRVHLGEGYVAQPVAMLHASAWAGRLTLQAMANLEGLTMPEGELSTGAHGEGFVDRRHPHSYVHEAMLGAHHRGGGALLSLTAGRGFASFGSDDPMVRPFAKYPLNHHLAQVLERVVVVGAARVRGVILEASTFNGDEPMAPAAAPAYSRVGDSWAARITADVPFAVRRIRHAAELSVSRARIASPESREGLGLDHDMWHASARLRGEGRISRYALVEVAGLAQRDEGTTSFRYGSMLAEAALCTRADWVAVRWERTDRPEESRKASFFRTPFPHGGDAIVGRTRWQVVTVALGTDRLRDRGGAVSPFVELSALRARQLEVPSVIVPAEVYGARTLAMLSVGARIRAGARHSRMGRYGAALPVQPAHSHDSSNQASACS